MFQSILRLYLRLRRPESHLLQCSGLKNPGLTSSANLRNINAMSLDSVVVSLADNHRIGLNVLSISNVFRIWFS
jgi:hypothetical protein